MIRLRITLAFLFCLTCAASAKADPLIIPVPLDSPVFVSLTTHPVITLGSRTIDFSPNLNQEFIHFLPVMRFMGPQDAYTFRVTVGIRARDGLASLSGVLPQSPDPSFSNTLPVFTVGTTDIIFFDLIIAGHGVSFSLTLTDMNGRRSTPMFGTPLPEPATIALLATGLIGAATAHRRRRKRNL